MQKISQQKFRKSPDYYWSLLRQGENEGLEGIYRMYAQDLFYFGLSLNPDRSFIQDCVQEVFIDLWKYHRRLQEISNVKLYLFKSISHKIYRENQRNRKQIMVAVYEENLESFSIEPHESSIIAAQREKELQLKVTDALEKLPGRQKQVIQLLFFEKFSYEEISQIMGIHVKSVYTLAWKALSSLNRKIVSFVCMLFFKALTEFWF